MVRSVVRPFPDDEGLHPARLVCGFLWVRSQEGIWQGGRGEGGSWEAEQGGETRARPLVSEGLEGLEGLGLEGLAGLCLVLFCLSCW